MMKYYVQVIKDGISLWFGINIIPNRKYFQVGEIIELWSEDNEHCFSIYDKDTEISIKNPYFNINVDMIKEKWQILTVNQLFFNKYIIDVTTSVEREKKLKEVLS